MNYHKTLVIILFLLTSITVVGQTNNKAAYIKPKVGEPCPDFKLSYVTHYPKKQVTLNDFKGKWLFLDFWFTNCTTCIKSFPKINQLQKEFKDKVQFLMVGRNDKKSNPNIEKVFEKLREKQGLDIASAYDSILSTRWGIHAMPYMLIISPDGIVKHITDGRDLNKEKIQELLDGKTVSLYSYELSRPKFDINLMGNDGTSFPKEKIIHHSILTKWNGEAQNGGYEIDRYASFPASEWKKGFKFAMVNLHWLYNTAYLGKYYFKMLSDSLYGKVYHYPILEIKDTTLFEYSYTQDFGKGLYNYSLVIPSDQVTKMNIMKYMQQDLERAFGYKGTVEMRKMPVWNIVAHPGTENRIRTKGGAPYNSASEGSIAAGFTVRNISMKDFMPYLCFYLSEKEKHPFIDATGIESNIDLTLDDVDLTNLEDVRKALQKHGLDLVKGTRKMKVLVIRDPISQ